jgi:UDP-glucose 4-epimerase
VDELGKALVTGGAGFLGSHLVDALQERKDDVIVVDNLTSGSMANLRRASDKGGLKFVKIDLKSPLGLTEILTDVTTIFHFAANPEVRVGATDPVVHFRENLLASFNLLEAARMSGGGKTLVFASTSTVYGEAMQMPTREDYGPMLPISTYGASKLGCESLISSYAYTHGLRALILRLGNCVGQRSGHGVTADFIRKLKTNPAELEILGDGTQTKSYVHVSDFTTGTFTALDAFLRSDGKADIYNLSSPDQVSVKKIAQIVTEQFGLGNVRMKFTGGVDGGRGWFGDVKVMHLSVEKLRKLGWQPNFNSEQSIRQATKEFLANAS